MSYCFGDPDMVRKPRPGDWTEEEIEKLRRYAKEGLSQQEAAECLGRSPNAVYRKSKSLGLPWPGRITLQRWSNRELLTLSKHAKTKTTMEIAEMLGRSIEAVRYKANAVGISLIKCGEHCRATRIPTSQIAEMFRLKEQGWTQRKIAEHFGVSKSQVQNVLTFRSRWRETLHLQ